MPFDSLMLSSSTLAELRRAQIHEPNEIQQRALPALVAGIDVVLAAPADSGKRTAWMLALLATTEWGRPAQALVVAATAAHANELLQRLRALGPDLAQHCTASAAEASKATVLVGEAASLHASLMRGRGTPRLLVVDAAEQFQGRNASQELVDLVELMPRRRQIVVATSGDRGAAMRLAQLLGAKPSSFGAEVEACDVATLQHHCYTLTGQSALKDLPIVLELHEQRPVLVCCEGSEDCAPAARLAARAGLRPRIIQAGQPIDEDPSTDCIVLMPESMGNLGELRFGLLINLALPDPPTRYVKRLRFVRSHGAVVTLMAPNQVGLYYQLGKVDRIAFKAGALPTREELAALREARRLDAVLERIASLPEPSEAALLAAQKLLGSTTAADTVARLLRALDEASVAQPS